MLRRSTAHRTNRPRVRPCVSIEFDTRHVRVFDLFPHYLARVRAQSGYTRTKPRNLRALHFQIGYGQKEQKANSAMDA
jgi:hypothetical protein